MAKRDVYQKMICERKIGYPSEDFAKRAAEATGHRIYKCDCCDGWHTTSKGTSDQYFRGPVWMRAERMFDLIAAKRSMPKDEDELERHRAFFRTIKAAMLSKEARNDGNQTVSNH